MRPCTRVRYSKKVRQDARTSLKSVSRIPSSWSRRFERWRAEVNPGINREVAAVPPVVAGHSVHPQQELGMTHSTVPVTRPATVPANNRFVVGILVGALVSLGLVGIAVGSGAATRLAS